MIEIIKKKQKKKKRDPYYQLTANYMIGDANGNTTEEEIISTENPYLERFVSLLNGLSPLSGTWGIVFDSYEFDRFLQEGQLSQEDYDFLYPLMFEEPDNEEQERLFEEMDDDYKYSFYDLIRGDAEYSFLVFEGFDLHYFDENGVKHKTKITN